MLPFSHTEDDLYRGPLTLMKPEGSGRVRDNIPTKMGAQTQRRESLTGEPRLARGADGVLNPRYNHMLFARPMYEGRPHGPPPGLRTPMGPLGQPASNRIGAELGRKSRTPP
jgi:hypothetical protein